jgi:phospholipid/cholesterol/gamma-HCH transport system substrate-binding protein
MSRLTLEAKVGLFVVLAFAGLGVVATTLEPLKFKKEFKNLKYSIVFSNVAGLEKDAPVRVAGVTVGKVVSVDVKGDKAVVEIVFLKPIKIYRNAKASIETMGLMGEKYVELDPGHPPAPLLPPNSVIENTKVPASMDEVMTSVNELLEKFNQSLTTPDGKNRLAIIMDNVAKLTKDIDTTISQINSVLNSNKETVSKILKNTLALTSVLKEELPQVMDNVNTLTTQLSQMAVENRDDIRQTVISLKKAVQRAPEIADRLDNLTAKLQELLNENNTKNIEETLKNVKVTTEELKALLAKVNEGKGTVGKLFNDDKLYESLTKTAKTLGNLADRFEKTKTFIGFRGDVNTRTGDTRGIMSLKIVPSKDHFYLLEVVGDSQGKVDRKDYYITYGSTVEKREEIETNYRTEFTLQYAKVFDDDLFHKGGKFVLRGGLKESTGGIGLDYIFNDKWMLSSDLWDGGRKDADGDDIPPHLRIGLRYNLNKNWFIYGGGDELLYHKWRGVYLGAGVMFGDNDIKYLLGSLPGGIK